LGPKPIWKSRLTSRKLAAAIRESLSNDLMREKAKEVSKLIDRENSLDMAVREVLKEEPGK